MVSCDCAGCCAPGTPCLAPLSYFASLGSGTSSLGALRPRLWTLRLGVYSTLHRCSFFGLAELIELFLVAVRSDPTSWSRCGFGLPLLCAPRGLVQLEGLYRRTCGWTWPRPAADTPFPRPRLGLVQGPYLGREPSYLEIL